MNVDVVTIKEKVILKEAMVMDITKDFQKKVDFLIIEDQDFNEDILVTDKVIGKQNIL